MTIIGLTGSIGTGKTFVASVFRSLGAEILDADRIAHDAIRRTGPAYRKIVRAFGPAILGSRRAIDRKRLGRIVFADSRKLKKLNRIVHPEVIRVIKKRAARVGRGRLVVIDAPLLVEAGLDSMVDALVVVACSRKAQLERFRKKSGLSAREVMKRLANQIPLRQKIGMADFVIYNNGTKAETRKLVRRVWEQAGKKKR
ncbi:MAG: dephospho-CoA kinase [Candidatus Omnitrophica bacterium]|nr:dephospho-CoA kinase [Candidatus Omnitrophota bacterium]